MNSKGFGCQKPAPRALSDVTMGLLPSWTQDWAPCHGTHVCTCTRQFWRVSFFKALMAWPQHLLHFLKTDRLWSSTCSSHAAALSRNDRTHTEAGQLPRRGQPRRLRPELSQRCQGGIPLWADSAASVELCQPHSSCEGCRQLTDVSLNQSNQPRGGFGLLARELLSWKLGFWFWSSSSSASASLCDGREHCASQ